MTPEISDHAIVRYAERSMGLPLQGLSDTQALEKLVELKVDITPIRDRLTCLAVKAAAYGAPVIIADGVKVCLRDETVVTVLEKSWLRRY